jgi:hypothetical protein
MTGFSKATGIFPQPITFPHGSLLAAGPSRVYRRDGERFARPVELTREAADTLTTPLLPELTLPLERIFRE